MADACCGGEAPAPAQIVVGAEVSDGRSWLPAWPILAAAGAAIAWLAGLIAEAAGHDDAATVLFIVAVVAGGSTFVPSTVRALFRGRLGVGLLMTIAAVGAIALGEIGEAASLAFLFSVSEAMEDWAVTRARRGLRAVLELVPSTTRVRRSGGIEEIATVELRVGDVVVLATGARMPTDGVLRSTASLFDVSAVTGESIPVEAVAGDVVLAGSINTGHAVEVEASTDPNDSTLARIVRTVEDAQDRKGRAQRLADRIARPLVPAILIVGLVIAVVGSLLGDPDVWIGRALVVLVAAAPCAFAISVPVTVLASIAAATRSGILIKGGAAIERLATVRTIAFDKTGTLTRNHPTVVDVVTIGGVSRDEVVALAAAVEALSEHPLAAAIVAAAGGRLRDATDVRTVAGMGVTGVVDGRQVRLGKPGFIDSSVIGADIARLQSSGATVVLVERDGITIGAIAVRDEVRSEAPRVVAALHAGGTGHIVMLTGDNALTARAVGGAIGIGDVRADLLPDDKLAAIHELQTGGPVAMVGDGINDAPALATADVGIAMGAAGSDIAIEAADVAIMGDSLDHLPALLTHARRTRRIMIQNLVMSGAIITILIPIAAFGVLGLGAVVATHELAEIVVIANGIRARRALDNPSDHAHRSDNPPAAAAVTSEVAHV